MDAYDEDSTRSIYTTPSNTEAQQRSQTRNETQDAAPSNPASPSHRPERPRAYRHSSLPRALFSSGSGSIFGSGSAVQQQQENQERPPTLAVSAPSQENLVTAHQSLATSGGAESSRRRTESWYEDDDRGSISNGRRRIPRVEKDKDDINSPPSSSRLGLTRQESTTLTTLSRLFAVRAPLSPETSRHSSYIQPHRTSSAGYTRNQIGEAAPLPDHLYTRGLLEGRHSDITVNAFGHAYKLHRLILDRAPFFRSALSEPWLESTAKETTIHPEDIDASITQTSFELALKRLYGFGSTPEEDREAVGLFATGCWLEMADLVESSIESMLRQMTPETLSPLIKLVTSNYYGRAGDKILASAKAMLCRDGWKMPLRYWDGIPGDVVREIVGGDGFFIDGEWDRWCLAKAILDRRLRRRALESGLTEYRRDANGRRRRKVLKAPDAGSLMAVRFDTVYRRNGAGSGRGMPDHLSRWISLYTHPDIEPILVLLDEGIHYLHLDFEQLQFIRSARDILGLPVMPEKVIGNALWQQMELRQKVMNARDVDMELDLSVRCTEDTLNSSAGGTSNANRDTTMSITDPLPSLPTPTPMGSASGKRKVEDIPGTSSASAEEDDYLESGSWDGNGKPRKFWIPTSDCNIVMGGNADPVIATSNNTTLQRHASRLSATIQPEDVQWASDFAAVTAQARFQSSAPVGAEGGGGAVSTSASEGAGAGSEVMYSHFPPFRFAASFPNPRNLKEKKRVYSRTVFYAGSLWNIYIQKVASSRSKQLGVYLHRAKERETEEVIAGTAGVGQGSVDERIGILEREMILGRERMERRGARRRSMRDGTQGEGDGVVEGGESSDFENEAPMQDASAGAESERNRRSSAVRNLLSQTQYSSGQRKSGGQNDVLATTTLSPSAAISGAFGTSSTSDFVSSDPLNHPNFDSDSSDLDTDSDQMQASNIPPHVPTIPPYVDQRPTIKTYFKIYSPSRGGRMLSVYESAPDRFNFSQSWGWKSSTLMLDEGMMGGHDEEGGDGGAPDGDAGGGGGKVGGEGCGREKEDGRLRFMVVIGNI